MAASDYEESLKSAKDTLTRVQEYEPESLVRREELGVKFAFEEAVEPAKQLIALYQKLPTDALREFPKNQLDKITQTARSTYSIFESIEDFDPSEADAVSTRTNLLKQLNEKYQKDFNELFNLISFAVARTVDFDRLVDQGRAAVQSVKDETAELTKNLEESSASATELLEQVRELAAEAGVTKQAQYFAEEAKQHEAKSGDWLTASYVAGGAVLLYSIAALFAFPTLEYLAPDTTPEAFQIIGAKILVFIVLAAIFLQCVRNFFAHRHNAVLNKHRQNSLLTYTTLAEAGSTPEARDTILQHAAAAIYSPGDTGYVRNEERGYSGNPVIGLTPGSIVTSSGQAQ